MEKGFQEIARQTRIVRHPVELLGVFVGRFGLSPEFPGSLVLRWS